jgi:hypothetical protein
VNFEENRMGKIEGSTLTRDRTLDVLRAVATVRVVLYHTSLNPLWSWFAAMPAMFFVGGALYAQSLERHSTGEVLWSRSRRILIPFWSWAAMVFVVFTVNGTWGTGKYGWSGIPGFVLPIVPPAGPGGTLYWTSMTLWYINAYFLCMLLGLPLRRLHQRAPRFTLVLLFIPILVSGLLRAPVIGVMGNLFFWVLGYSFHDRRASLPGRRTCLGVAVGASVAGVAYAVGTGGLGQLTTGVPFLNWAVGLAWVAFTVAIGPQINQALRWRPFDVSVQVIQQRAMTIYLWHALVNELMVRYTNISTSVVLRSAMVLLLTAALTLLLGWIEDYAADRPLRVIPALRVAELRKRPAALLAVQPLHEVTSM